MIIDINETYREIILVLAVVLLGVLSNLIPKAWKGVEKRLLAVSDSRAKKTTRLCFKGFVLAATFTLGLVLVEFYQPDWVQSYCFMVMCLIGVGCIIYILFAGIQRLVRSILKKGKAGSRLELDGTLVLYYLSLGLLALSALFAGMAIIGSSLAVLGLNVGLYQADNYQAARWHLADGLLCFVMGLGYLGLAHGHDKVNYLKLKGKL